MNALRMTIALMLATCTAAAAQAPCSHETVSIRGTALTISFCVNGSPATAGSIATVPMEATYETKGRSMALRSTLRFIVGEGPARALQSVNLAPVGLEGTLHMTLLYSGNQVSMEHALLTPGAVTVK